MKISFIIILFLVLAGIGTPAAHAGYTVDTHPPPGAVIDANGTDSLISFYDLPLWIQISWIAGCILAVLGLIAFWPVIISRIRNVLKSKNRLLLLDYIKDHPGCTITDLTKGTGINRGSVKYHLLMLLAERKIVEKKSSKMTHLFANGGMQLEKKQIYGYIRNPAKKQILSEIRSHPGICNKEIAEHLQLGKSTVHWHLQQLLEEKMVVGRWDGRNTNYVLVPEVETILLEHLDL